MEGLSYNELKKRFDEITIRYEILNIAQSLSNLEEIVRGILNFLEKFFKFENLSIYLINEKAKSLISYKTSSHCVIQEQRETESILDSNLIQKVCNVGEILVINDDYGGNGLFKIFSPLKYGESPTGVFIGQRYKPFTQEEVSLFEIASKQFATIIENTRSEERYRSVVEKALDGVILIDDEERILYINERMASLLGYGREELIGKDFKQFTDDEGKRILKNITSLKSGEEEVTSCYELNIIQRGSGIRNVEISSTCIRDSAGSINVVAFLKDITEKKKLEIQLLQTERLRAIAEMAAGVAHDFNNALSIILGNIQLLQLSVHDPNILETLGVIEKVAKDSAQTVRRLHDFTKNRSRKDLKPLDINSVIKDAVIITRPKWKNEAQGKGFDIDVICDLTELPPVMGNASELREVITNMIFNSIEAMPDGGRIEIRSFFKDQKVFIQISDTGIGMDEEVKRRIFEPFFTTKPFTNSGLGLSMCYGIIRSFGGNIEVESKLGKGTTFTIILPISKLQEKIEDRLKTERVDSRARILVIEDEELIRDVLYKGLSNAQHQVTIAKDGLEGIDLFRKMEFDIVLTDLGMPNISGWEVCKAIKEISPLTPVGMITGWKVELDEMKNEEKGPDFIILKPFDFHDILGKINESLMTLQRSSA